MTENERIFWNRVLELAESRLTRGAFEYYLTDINLHSIEDQIAIIVIPDSDRRLFLEKNLSDIILTAGFEVFDLKITDHYVLKNELPETKKDEALPSANLAKPAVADVESNLKSQYTFDNFIRGKGNEWALSASIAVAQDPGGTYNPLFIYGGPGLGKTHLLNAIGNTILENNPNTRLKYITAEDFLNEFTRHMRQNEGKGFQEKFRTLDLLLIDDIQFLARRNLSGTQEEFFHTFDALHKANKQIVLTSDRTPDELKDLQDRIITRFSWGLTIDITPPDFETRVAILIDKVKEYPYEFPIETIKYLATQFHSNVRELEGALKDINLVANVKQLDLISIDTVSEAIRARKNDRAKTSSISIEAIQEEVGKFYSVTVREIKATKRNQDIVLARQVAMFLARELTDSSLPKIGKAFGGRDHSTVLHAYNKIKNMIEKDDGLRLEIENLQNKIL